MSIDWSPAAHAPLAHDAADESRVMGVATEAYLNALERGLRLAPEETCAIVAEVRGNLEDLAAHLRAQGYAADDAAAEAVRRFDDAGRLARSIRRARRDPPWPPRLRSAPSAARGSAPTPWRRPSCPFPATPTASWSITV